MPAPLTLPLGRTSLPPWVWMPAYLVCYVLFDWASFVRPVPGLNITAWNPQQALAIAVLLWQPRTAWLVFGGLVAAELAVRGVPARWVLSAAAACALTATLAAMARALHHVTELTLPLTKSRELLGLLVVVTVGSLASAFLFVMIHSFELPVQQGALAAMLRYWVGDAVSLLVTLPALLIAISPVRRATLAGVLRNAAWWAGALLTCGALWVIFWSGEQNFFKFFYLLLPPVVWAAVRFGLEGAAAASLFTQIGLLVSGHAALQQDLTLFELQVLMAATAFTALLLGVTVDERARAEAELRASLRFSAAGQMAAALAHELGQPLTAASNYAEACQQLAGEGIDLDPPRREQLTAVLRKLAAEVRRTGTVVRRLRDLFTSGATSLQPVAAAALMQEAIEAQRDFAQHAGVALVAQAPADLPVLRVDRVQIGVVLRNLLANAIESAGAAKGQVLLRAASTRDGVRMDVIDTGPGLGAERIRTLFEAPPSDKPGGLGVGLSICRSIVESHGGKLWAEPGSGGHVSFLLPFDEPESEPSAAARR
jgi:two-component system, LuxR family, sensor kinase FixL